MSTKAELQSELDFRILENAQDIQRKNDQLQAHYNIIHSIGEHYITVLDGLRTIADSLVEAHTVYVKWAKDHPPSPIIEKSDMEEVEP